MSDLDPHHLRLVEAILFAAAEPMTASEIGTRLPEGADVGALLGSLQATYAGRGVNLVQAGDTWAFSTAADLAPWLRRDVQVEKKLSRAAIETLAIIAYHQPVTRAEIEDARGVQLSRGTLDTLFAQGWVRPHGRREAPGRPALWVTTDGFLRHFGLGSLDDLPRLEELKAAGLLDNGHTLQTYYSEGNAGLHEAHDGQSESETVEEYPPRQRPGGTRIGPKAKARARSWVASASGTG